MLYNKNEVSNDVDKLTYLLATYIFEHIQEIQIGTNA